MKKGYKIGDTTFKVHLDGYNLLPFLSGKEKRFAASGLPLLERRRRSHGAARPSVQDRFRRAAWAPGSKFGASPCSRMRIPKLFDLRSDPFERGEESFKYNDWFLEHMFAQYAAQAIVHEWLESFKEFPPGRRPRASLSIRSSKSDAEELTTTRGGGKSPPPPRAGQTKEVRSCPPLVQCTHHIHRIAARQPTARLGANWWMILVRGICALLFGVLTLRCRASPWLRSFCCGAPSRSPTESSPSPVQSPAGTWLRAGGSPSSA